MALRRTYFIAGLLAFPALAATSSGAEIERRYAIGVHDIAVRDVDSHTYGITAALILDERTASGAHLFGDLDLFWDHDQDHLDPDHISIWWQLHAGSDGELWRSTGFHLDWIADVDTRANTVSSVERQIAALPALAARFDGDRLHASIAGGYGYWFLEIDDDAPRERGYERDGLRRTTWAESLSGEMTFRVGQSVTIIGRAQEWWDGSEWLYAHYAGELHLSTDRWISRSEIALNAELNEYNFDPYNKPGLPSVVPWNDDMLFTVRFTTTW
jgi:hypothetical protein